MSAKFNYSEEMLSHLIKCLKDYKSVCEFSGVDFNGDKETQYEEIRKLMSQKYEKYFGPKALALIEGDATPEEKIRVMKKIDEEKGIIRVGYKRVMEKVRKFRQGFTKAVNEGIRSGQGKMIELYYDALKDLYGSSASVEPLEYGTSSSSDQDDSLLDQEHEESNEENMIVLKMTIVCHQFLPKKGNQMIYQI